MKPIVLADTKKLDHDQWLEYRKKGIGGSDAAAIAGINPYKNAVAVYYDKVGEIEKEDLYSVNDRGGFEKGNEAAYWGNRDETEVAKEFYLRTGKRVRRRNAIFQHAEHEFMLANIDREIVGENAGLECKITGEFNKDSWQEGETIPEQYYIQCQHYMAVTGREKWYIAVKIGGNKFHWDLVERDEEIIENLAQLEGDFWQDVLDHQPPEMDGTESSKAVLEMLYPAAETVQESIDLPTETDEMIAELDQLKADLKEGEKRKKELENKVKSMLGANEFGTSDEYFIKWGRVDASKLDSKQLKQDHPEIYEEYKKSSSYRKFSYKKAKKQEEKAVS